jgi:hypothetical protein
MTTLGMYLRIVDVHRRPPKYKALMYHSKLHKAIFGQKTGHDFAKNPRLKKRIPIWVSFFAKCVNAQGGRLDVDPGQARPAQERPITR